MNRDTMYFIVDGVVLYCMPRIKVTADWAVLAYMHCAVRVRGEYRQVGRIALRRLPMSEGEATDRLRQGVARAITQL